MCACGTAAASCTLCSVAGTCLLHAVVSHKAMHRAHLQVLSFCGHRLSGCSSEPSAVLCDRGCVKTVSTHDKPQLKLDCPPKSQLTGAHCTYPDVARPVADAVVNLLENSSNSDVLKQN